MNVSQPWETMDALGGAAPNPTNMAGGGRAVQRETLKAFGLSHGRFLPPGYRSATDAGKSAIIAEMPPAVESRFEP